MNQEPQIKDQEIGSSPVGKGVNPKRKSKLWKKRLNGKEKILKKNR